MGYAKGTSVPVESSEREVRRIIARYGADQFMIGQDRERVMVGFRAHGRLVKFFLPMPDPDDKAFRRTPTGRPRNQAGGLAITKAYEAEVRRRWRALVLVLKAKLEAVRSSITTFEREFMAHIVLPDGRTVAEHAEPAIQRAYETGRVVPLLPEAT